MNKRVLSDVVKDTKVFKIEQGSVVILNDLNVLQKDTQSILAIYSFFFFFSESIPPNYKKVNLLPS